MADWFAQNAPPTAAPPAGDWFAKNAPQAQAAARRDGVGDALTGLAEGAKDVGAGALRSLVHPLNAIKSVWDGMKTEADESAAQANKGDLGKALVHALGIFPVLGPAFTQVLDGIDDPNVDAHELGRRVGQALILEAAPDVTKGVAKAAGAAIDAGPAIKAGIKAAAPDVAAGTAKAATGAALASVLPGSTVIRDLVGLPGMMRGGTQIGKGIRKGFAAGKAALAAPAAAVAEAAPAVADAAQADPELFDGLSKGIFGGKYSQLNEEQQATIRGYAAAPQRRAPAAASPATPAAATPTATAPPVARISSLPAPDQYAATDQDFMPSWEPGPPGTPPPAQRWEPYAEYQKPAEAAPAQNAAITEAQRIEDAADEHAARLQMQAEDIIWGSRARKADRFADYLTKNKLEPTPDNLATAARAMSERAAPSDETVPMVHDRMGYQPPSPAIEDLPSCATTKPARSRGR